MDNVKIRLETKNDWRAVEELTREAFWNVYQPGASEHYYVHEMRKHPDFLPELAFVLELGGREWMYIASTAVDCCEDQAAVETFDRSFPPKEKKWTPSQKEFYIYRNSSVVRQLKER